MHAEITGYLLKLSKPVISALTSCQNHRTPIILAGSDVFPWKIPLGKFLRGKSPRIFLPAKNIHLQKIPRGKPLLTLPPGALLTYL